MTTTPEIACSERGVVSTHHGSASRWWHIAATIAVGFAAVSIAAATAPAADAAPKPPGPSQGDNYLTCVGNSVDAWQRATGKTGVPPNFKAMSRSCCTDEGGIFNERNGDCYLPDGTTYGPWQPPPSPDDQVPDAPRSPSDQGPTDQGVPPVISGTSPPASSR